MQQCPKCGGAVRKLVASPAFQFKGSGWYVTDYARKDSGAEKPDGTAAKPEGSKDSTTAVAPAKDAAKPASSPGPASSSTETAKAKD